VSGALKAVPQVGVMMTGLSSEFTRKYYRGSLQRVEPGTVPIPVLRDGSPAMLPAIHARGALKAGSDSGVADFWFLDDPANALLLRWSFQGRTAEIVHIDAPDRKEAASARMTTALSSPASARSTVAGAGCHVALHGIYFDSGSADLLPISDATLSDVASLIKAHPEWNLTIEGHTDNIGSATSNQDLSQRRAQAVRQALIHNHGVPPVHLLAQGFGATRPVDSNSTAVGRAHNRRVELARACH
ncbi:MAG TPA: OmpA family protein, partial [Rhodanobacter sp.]|nr:OmpA family protein [Rhodanobacter sp.]